MLSCTYTSSNKLEKLLHLVDWFILTKEVLSLLSSPSQTTELSVIVLGLRVSLRDFLEYGISNCYFRCLCLVFCLCCQPHCSH
jgi:hypothetical protein